MSEGDSAYIETAEFLAFQEKVRGTNINAQTLLATDYLNHFNEVVMLFEMVADMPDMYEEIQVWEPATYKEHFERSTFSDKDLAVEAYDHVPPQYKEAFEHTLHQIDRIIQICLERTESAIMLGDPGRIRADISLLIGMVNRLIDVAGGIINGSSKTMEQSEIDILIETDPPQDESAAPSGSSQADIDALFD